ncbi:MAG: hypothetical protein V1728_02745 [Candidatus Micrarchaeota archaeon]
MANITLSVPDALYARMRAHSEYRWSDISRKAIEQKLADAEMIEDLRALERAEKNFKAGKTVSYEEVGKRLGL